MLQMTGICKSFPGVKALQSVDFAVRRGEVHALMGENGAGKSTLIKVLTGIYEKDAGEIVFDGKRIALSTASQAQSLGIRTIYQELNLIPYLSVAENIFLGREPRRFGLIDWRAVKSRAAEIFENMGVTHVDVRRPICEQSVAIAQMTAIARAISTDAKLLVMDEPTSSLSENEVRILFDVIERVKRQGTSVIFISHKMSEVFEISDRTTVLRDGLLVGTYPMADLTKLELVSLMIGRDATSVLSERRPTSTDLEDRKPLLGARRLSRGQRTKQIDIDIKTGEILGVSGLLGSGRTELVKILFGDTPAEEGTIEIGGDKTSIKSPRDAIRLGLGFCSEDRKAEGIFPTLSVMENMTLGILPELSKGGVVASKKQREIVETYIERLGIKCSGPEQRMKELSGGNQQKVLLARWLCKKPILMILDEPTRGIDLGAKSEIEHIIADLASRGVAVLMISSEMEELVRSCDRIVVLSEGKKVGELKGSNISEENIVDMIAHGNPSLEGAVDE